MALPTNIITLEELMVNEGDERLLRIQKEAEDHLPEGWRTWPVTAEASTDELNIETQAFNKLRFALPSVATVEAFYSEIKQISERAWRKMKEQMLAVL